MSRGIGISFAVVLGVQLFVGNTQSREQSEVTKMQVQRIDAQPQTGPHTRQHAVAKVAVQTSEAKPYDDAESPQLVEVRIEEAFTGDLNGESSVRALEVQHGDKSGSMISMQRFRGKLAGREGTFVLQGSEIVENGKITAKWSVVPKSGTGDLSGLRGEGGFEGRFGKGSDGWLDYWFE